MQNPNSHQAHASSLRYHAYLPQTLLGRALAFLLVALVVALAVVFSVVFLAVGAVLLLIAVARGMCRAKTMGDRGSTDFIDGEYTVEPDPGVQRLVQRSRDAGDGASR
jgi:hypothetical protein